MEIRTEEFTDMASENRINSPLNEGCSLVGESFEWKYEQNSSQTMRSKNRIISPLNER